MGIMNAHSACIMKFIINATHYEILCGNERGSGGVCMNAIIHYPGPLLSPAND